MGDQGSAGGGGAPSMVPQLVASSVVAATARGRGRGRGATGPATRGTAPKLRGAKKFAPKIPTSGAASGNGGAAASANDSKHSDNKKAARGGRGTADRGRGRGGRGRGANRFTNQDDGIFSKGFATRTGAGGAAARRAATRAVQSGGGGGSRASRQSATGEAMEDGGDYESDSDIDEDAPAYGGSWLNETTAEQRPTFLPMHDKKLQKQVLPPGIVPDDDEDTVAADPAGDVEQDSGADVFLKSLQDEESRLLFLQFPDMLPGLMINGQLGTLPEDVEPTGAERCANLRDLPAGIIGRLRIRRSGKMELVMGNVTFEVHEGTRASHLQELMMIDHDGGQPTAYNLGQVDRKFIVAPDVSTLLAATSISDTGTESLE